MMFAMITPALITGSLVGRVKFKALFFFNKVIIPQQIGLTSAPMINADQIGTKPAPGVIATSPTTRPVEAPTKVGFSSFITSISIHDIMALALAIAEVKNA